MDFCSCNSSSDKNDFSKFFDSFKKIWTLSLKEANVVKALEFPVRSAPNEQNAKIMYRIMCVIMRRNWIEIKNYVKNLASVLEQNYLIINKSYVFKS